MFSRTARLRPAHALSAVGLLAVCAWTFTGPSYDDLRQDGDRMAEAVERYRLQHGHYPESLEDAGVVVPGCAYAAWRYRCYDNHYRLSVGDTEQDGFVLTYRSASGKWELNGEPLVEEP